MHDIISSSIATCIAELVTIPIYTVKTNYQNTNMKLLGCVGGIYSKYGIKGFYNSSGIAIFSQILSTSIKYTLYQKFKPQLPSKILAGTISGICSSVVTHPIDVIKVHLQMHTPLNINNISIFYRGYSKSLFKSSVGTSCFFPLYDIFNEKLQNNTLSALYSSILSTIILQPIDYMKTRQIYGLHIGYNPIFYYKGLSLNLLRIVPHFMITIMVIEYLKNI
jgi:hypothetical protein